MIKNECTYDKTIGYDIMFSGVLKTEIFVLAE